MRIQVLSDVHAEIDPRRAQGDVVDLGVDLVILAGDIDQGGAGVRWAAETWPTTPVVYVLGNHEHYTTRMGEALERARAAANGKIQDALASNSVNVVAGTAWLWAREEMRQSVDVLIIDEAGQMALARALAVALAARNVVLLGDPRQLEQPVQGSHPEGTDVAALDHLIGGHRTIPSDRGLFLDTTFRLSPGICRYTSDFFYEGRLTYADGVERQQLHASPTMSGNGLWLLPVEHRGNQVSSPEEVEAIEGLVARLLETGAKWTDRNGNQHPLEASDILVVAPYNSQVTALAKALPDLQVGTVDKFQGREAPIVIYSMATSSPEDAPRGMAFLYSDNRTNVATSRAQCAAVLVCEPRLLTPDCNSPEQMRLANAFCGFAEQAHDFPGAW